MYVFNDEESKALIELIEHEQMHLTNDEDNEFWNNIRRKVKANTR